jgi:hypothetical protein
MEKPTDENAPGCFPSRAFPERLVFQFGRSKRGDRYAGYLAFSQGTDSKEREIAYLRQNPGLGCGVQDTKPVHRCPIRNGRGGGMKHFLEAFSIDGTVYLVPSTRSSVLIMVSGRKLSKPISLDVISLFRAG